MSEKFIVETSARHLHLTQQDFETLFGAGAQPHPKKNLSQPGQFACEEKITVVGPKGSLKMSLLGPFRSQSQVEVSYCLLYTSPKLESCRAAKRLSTVTVTSAISSKAPSRRILSSPTRG